jgi:hypothetical protein
MNENGISIVVSPISYALNDIRGAAVSKSCCSSMSIRSNPIFWIPIWIESYHLLSTRLEHMPDASNWFLPPLHLALASLDCSWLFTPARKRHGLWLSQLNLSPTSCLPQSGQMVPQKIRSFHLSNSVDRLVEMILAQSIEGRHMSIFARCHCSKMRSSFEIMTIKESVSSIAEGRNCKMSA